LSWKQKRKIRSRSQRKQIKQNRPTDFIKATYGFSKDNEDTVLSATSPFTFSEISESAIFRFLKLIECDNSKIGTYTKLVKDRNASAHPNGVIQVRSATGAGRPWRPS
jgi:hypothetical protein